MAKRRSGMVAMAAGMLLALAGGAAATEHTTPLPHASHAVTTGPTSVPYGWVDFCARYQGECDGPDLLPQDVALTARTWRDLERIDRQVNAAIIPTTDMEHWGVVDRWDYPTDGRGDCEDYALEKRRLLIAAGFPRQALLMTVVKDHTGEGHAILTVKTDRGEFVLDNMNDTVEAWDATGYRFVKRQSQANQNAWEGLSPATAAPQYTAR